MENQNKELLKVEHLKKYFNLPEVSFTRWTMYPSVSARERH